MHFRQSRLDLLHRAVKTIIIHTQIKHQLAQIGQLGPSNAPQHVHGQAAADDLQRFQSRVFNIAQHKSRAALDGQMLETRQRLPQAGIIAPG